jgi:DNA-binding MarR family transcriptional regulator/predicted N-acetyltransferase YhbS
MEKSEITERAGEVRRFNRFYTKRIGILHERLMDSPFSLTEVRVLYEIANRAEATAAEISAELELDRGYLSRLLADFKKRGLITSKASAVDARRSLLSMTAKGRRMFDRLNQQTQAEVEGMLETMSPEEQRRLLRSMREIRRLLGGNVEPRVSYILRPHQPGDIGWITHRHGALYAQEYGWNEEFEALVAQIAAKFIQNFNPARERCWIAEREGEIAGSILLVEKSKTVAQLRLLLVEPSARGLGIGRRLVEECVRFARLSGYRKIVLWTDNQLHTARGVYEKAGFQLKSETPHHSFGHDLVGQMWELKL